jgi:choline-sulfatase
MNKKSFLLLSLTVIIAGIIAGIWLFSGKSMSPLFQKNRYNILLITLDAARADRIADDKTPPGLTPNIDKIKHTGIIFKRAYCYSGSTPPSMTAMFTSKMPYWPPKSTREERVWRPETVFGLMRFFPEGEVRPGIPESLETLPTVLKKNGYMTCALTNNAHLVKDFGFHRGFDFYEELADKSPYARAEEVTRKTLAFLSELKDERFFIWAHFMDLHAPLLEFKEYIDRAEPLRIKTDPLPVSEWTDNARENMQKFGSRYISDWENTEPKLLEAREKYTLAYDALVMKVDRQIGLIVETLKNLELWDNTLIILMNDHGDEFMEHGEWTHQGQVYQEIVRGIWIMHNPKLFPEPRVTESLASHLDFMPTLLDILGIKHKNLNLDGISRFPSLGTKRNKEENYVFGLLTQRSFIVQDNLKLIINSFLQPEQGSQNLVQAYNYELFDLEKDPHERQNIAEKFPQVVENLQAKLKHAFLEADVQSRSLSDAKEKVSEETLERLRSLGYIHK